MMQKRKLSSLLLISFIVVFGFSFAAANTVDFGASTQLRCEEGALQNFSITAAQDIVGFEIIAEVSGDYTGLPSVSFTAAVPTGWTTFIAYRGDGVSPDTIRLAAIRLDASDPVIAAGTYNVATLSISTADVCQGAISISGGDWTDYANPTGTITTQFIDASATIYEAATSGGSMTIDNEAPTLEAIAGGSVTWNAPGNVFNATAAGSDGDETNGCETLTYTLTTKPGGMTIDGATGEISWTADGDDVCTHAVTVKVEDKCGASATTSFSICVTNEAPIVADLDAILIGAGTEAVGQFAGSDPDGGPSGLLYEIASFDGPGSVVLDAATGEFTWNASVGEELETSYTLCVSVSDQTPICDPCNSTNADTACVTIEVVPLRYVIEKTHGTFQGGFTTVDIMMPNDGWMNYPIGGFEFLIQYDASALSFLGAEAGSFVVNCGWEYFTYRTGAFGNCGNACPSGMVKIIGLAETNNGNDHPVEGCTNTQGNEQIARLKFYVSNDRTLECQYVPIRFTWLDCADNSVSSEDGKQLFWGNRVFDYDGPIDPGNFFMLEYYKELVLPPQVPNVFPSIWGPTAECDEIDSEKADIFSYIDFFNGGIDIVCGGDIDDRGDINLDGIAYTIADAVMYSNYFVHGLTALVNDPVTGYAASTAASDVNADGLALTVADLVYLVRVVVGDAQPYPKEVVSVDATITYTNDNYLSVGDVEMGAAFIIVSGNVQPTLLADNMKMDYSYDGQNTRVLVWGGTDALESFSGEFLAAGGEVISIELATADASMVVHKLIPTEFGLAQNYPNPFNPSTTIEFNMPQAGDYAMTIYNVTGQVVAEFNGSGQAGVEEVVWEASRNASGVYFYKLTMNGFSSTKKMVLLK